MYYRFKELEVFPSKEIVNLPMPECFTKKYPSTTIIIDATVIYVEPAKQSRGSATHILVA